MAKAKVKAKVRLLVLTNCKDCPHRKIERTENAGYAHDWICHLKDRKIAGYIEWPSEEPKEIPEWCPLEVR